MTITRDLLTNGAFGFPRGAKRRVKPVALMCLHITGNASNVGPTAAQGERDYANRAGSNGPSAHDYLNRDGSGVEAVDPAYAAWSNGDIQSPKTALQIVKNVQALMGKGYNANEAYYREVEHVGYPGTYPVTAAQLEQDAQWLARDSIATGLPINRSTVGQHSDVNTVTRPHCANLTEAQLGALITRANAVKAALTAPPEVDMPGIALKLTATGLTDPRAAFGTAKIAGAGHDLISVATAKPAAANVPDGYDLGEVQKATIAAPAPGWAALGEECVTYNVAGVQAVSPLRDVTFTPLPTLAPAVTTTIAPVEVVISQNGKVLNSIEVHPA